jgi:Fe-S-cluster containining protein
MCPALDAQGHCRVYASRPLICRSYGVPLRHRREVTLVNPPIIDVCDKNFIGTPLKMLPSTDVLDQTSLDATLSGIDAEYCDRNGLPAGERIPIAQILATPDRERVPST